MTERPKKNERTLCIGEASFRNQFPGYVSLLQILRGAITGLVELHALSILQRKLTFEPLCLYICMWCFRQREWSFILHTILEHGE